MLQIVDCSCSFDFKLVPDSSLKLIVLSSEIFKLPDKVSMVSFKMQGFLVFLSDERVKSFNLLAHHFELVFVLNQFSVAFFKVHNSSSQLFDLSLVIANSSFIVGDFLIDFNLILFIDVNLSLPGIHLKSLNFLFIL